MSRGARVRSEAMARVVVRYFAAARAVETVKTRMPASMRRGIRR
jgi:hypothetical protein